MLSSVKSAIKRNVVAGLQGDAEIYYGRFKGTSEFLPLLVKNVLGRPAFLKRQGSAGLAFFLSS